MADRTAIENARVGRPIRVSLPRKVAFDYDSFVKVQQDILDRLGCRACCSDLDIRWDFELDFVVGPDLDVRSF